MGVFFCVDFGYAARRQLSRKEITMGFSACFSGTVQRKGEGLLRCVMVGLEEG